MGIYHAGFEIIKDCFDEFVVIAWTETAVIKFNRDCVAFLKQLVCAGDVFGSHLSNYAATINRYMANTDLIQDTLESLRHFTKEQVETNRRILEELHTIGERIDDYGDVRGTLTEQSDMLRERFEKIHQQMGSFDDRAERNTTRINQLEEAIAVSYRRLKLMLIGTWLAGVLCGGLIGAWGLPMMRMWLRA